MDVQEALVRRGGVGDWRGLSQGGVTRRSLRHAVASGSVLRVRIGVYALADAPPPLIAAMRLGGVLAGPSAARTHGWDVLHHGEPWVAVPRTWSKARLPGVRVLRVDLRTDEVAGPATAPVRTLLDCARRLPVRDAVVILDSALRAGVSHRRLESLAQQAHGPGAVALRRAIRAADRRSESVIETCVRLSVWDLGPRVQPQVVIPGVGRVDLLIDGWLVIEGDGFAFHSDRTSYRQDRARAQALAAQGYVLLRFSYEDAVFRPEWVRQTVLAVLATRA